MEQFEPLLREHAYTLIFVLGFAEYVGVPVAATPLLLTVGVMTASGRVSFLGALIAMMLGGLLGDLFWYSLLRWRGHRVVRFACGLSANPNVCVVRASAAVSKGGTARTLFAKFIPGLGAVTAAASGLAKVPALRFVVTDLTALGVWAGFYLAVGRLFSDQLSVVVEFMKLHTRDILVLAAVLLVVAVSLRGWKLWRHRAAHAAPRASSPRVAEAR